MERLTYKASEGMTYKRKADGHIMGNELYLGLFIDGTEDTIDNYEEVVDASVAEARTNANEPMKRLVDKIREWKTKNGK